MARRHFSSTLERVPPQGESKELHTLTSTHLAWLDQGFTVAEPGHGDHVRCGAVRVAVASEPLWFGSISTCVFHVSGCGWSCVLESRPLYARSRYENGDGGAMPVTKKVTEEGVLGVPWVARWEASGAGRPEAL
jgi:hypothetical protein